MCIKAELLWRDMSCSMKWQPISTAPPDSDIEVCVIEGVPHVLISPCRLTDVGWIDARTKRLLDIRPTHWRELQPSADRILLIGESPSGSHPAHNGA